MTKATILTILLCAVLLVPVGSSAQYPFGKNKVIYNSRDWKVLKTEHVDIYHYPNDSNMILHVAPLVEETFLEFSELFGVEFRRRLPFVFYSSHYDFQETNILPYLISEYTGGFTDLMKGRVAVPFTGSYANFRHVVRHELVHAFMLEKLSAVMLSRGKFNYAPPPLWFVEGMAEYFAHSPQGSEGNMFVRDALVNDRLLDLDEIWRIQGSFMMYKEGEAVLNYIAMNFGEKAIIQIIENWWTADRFPQVLKNTINMDLVELNDAFMKQIKRKYYPSILRSSFATDIGRQLTPPRSFHNRPAVVMRDDGDDGYDVYCLIARDGAINVGRLVDGKGKYQRDHIMARGARSPSLESIPAFRSKIEAHGDTLVFVSKSSERDVIYFWDTRKGKKRAAFSFSGLSLLSSPTLSGDRSRMVFSAIDSTGRMDLFLYHIAERQLDRLTDDGFSEEDADYNPVDETILFTSDRDAGIERARTHIYRMDLTTREITAIEGGNHADSNPEWAPDGKSFLFVSDREGTRNVYHHKGNVIVRQTNALGAVTSPSFIPDGSGFVATVYTAGEFHLFEFPLRNGKGGQVASVAPADTTVEHWHATTVADTSFVSQDYSMKLGVDFVGAGIAIDPEFGDVGNGGQVVLTDILGNHQFFVFFGNTSDGFDNFWKRVNAGVTYVNLSHRLNYSLSLFHLNTYSFDTFTDTRRERRFGGAVGARYPLNKFQRLEASLVARQIERESEFSAFGLGSRESFTGSAFLSYVHDNTLWTIGGPLVGWRYYVTGGQTVDFLGRGFANTNFQVDTRHYFKLTQRTVVAARYMSRNTWGSDEQIFYLGGPWSLRGYDFREFRGRTIHLVNTEIRFPLIDRFAIALPFGVIEMPMFRGALFFDAGQATRNKADIFDTEWLGSFGLGTELNLGYAPVIRVNFTRTTDFDTISPDTGFELFIGFNY